MLQEAHLQLLLLLVLLLLGTGRLLASACQLLGLLGGVCGGGGAVGGISVLLLLATRFAAREVNGLWRREERGRRRSLVRRILRNLSN